MNDYIIEKGDVVAINFHGAQLTLCHRAVVKATKQHSDMWTFFDLDKKILHHVGEPCTITLLKKGVKL